MTAWKLIFRSLTFYARSHAAVSLGAAIGSAVLIGALVVGDSVRGSLREFALARLGAAHLALASNDRFFRERLAEDLQSPQSPMDTRVAPALQLLGTAAAEDGSARANRVQLLGADDRFWGFAKEAPSFTTPSPNEAVLNVRLASQLKVKVGDTIVLRVPKPSQLSREAPIAPQEDLSVVLRVKVSAIASDGEFGRFSLQANQTAPFNAFVSLAWLQERLKLPGRANLLLAGESDLIQASAGLRQCWQLADAELELRELPAQGMLELRSPRVFIEPPVAQAALEIGTNSTGLLTYFVNELRVGERTTPYSMVTAIGGPFAPPDMANDEILINQWLADDLQAHPGDELRLTYFIVGTARKLEERSTRFRIRSVLPMRGPTADRELMPEFPGMTDAENCRDWDTGFPIDSSKIREKDEKYWHEYRGTPKAFVSLAAGQGMWSNRFGDLTAVRYPSSSNSFPDLAEALHRQLDPASVGLAFRPVRGQAVAASEQSFDFGQLFLGFSFFLIVAALLLMALFFQFGIEQRSAEIGTLLALGFPPQQVRRLFLGEGCALAAIGSVVGVVGGLAYARTMLHGLSTIWREAVGTSALQFHVEPMTLITGVIASTIIAVLTILLGLRTQGKRPARELLTETGEFESAEGVKQNSGKGYFGTALGLGASAAVIIGIVVERQGASAAGAFFGAGTLLLMSGLAFSAGFLWLLSRSKTAKGLSITAMGVRNVTRSRRRSLTTLGLLACGSFLVMAVGVFRIDPNQGTESRESGTGGFALFGESSLSVAQDLNSREGLEFYGVDAQTTAGIRVVPFRVREGDDASCLNLNRAQTPRVLGVRPDALQDLRAFTFAAVAGGFSIGDGWNILKSHLGASEVPAVADQASIQWALGRRIGDTLTYLDERGRTFKVRLVGALANSVLQGSLILSETNFLARFPSESGYRVFLIDAPSNQLAHVSTVLSRSLSDVGLELTPSKQRLAEFNAVQNTYLSTFQVLGGLGLLLGSVGLGVVVLRNVTARRGELAVLLAMGFRPRLLEWLILSEHLALLLSGLVFGVLAALVAVAPALASPGSQIPYASLALTLGGVFASGALGTWLATLFALRGRILEALQNN